MELIELNELMGPGTAVPGGHDTAVCGVAPRAVAVPPTREAAAHLLARAGDRGWAVVPRGGGTLLAQGAPPTRLDLLLSTARLNRLVDYQPDDMTVTVEAGMTLAALAALLGERGQVLPLNPPLPERATVGGTVAAAATGSLRAGYGSPRDWVIGLRVLDSSGQEVRGGGQVVKNVAGYDLPKLYTGSFGTLGLITEVTFKVLPRPEATAYCRAALPDAAHVEGLLAALFASPLEPAAVELVHNWSAAADPAAGLPPWSLLVQFLHCNEAVVWQARAFQELAAGVGAAAERLPERTGERLLAELRDLPATVPFLARLATVSNRVAPLAAAAVDAAAPHADHVAVWAHAATGQLYVGAGEAVDPELPRALEALARGAGARCLFPRLPAPLQGQVDPWGAPGPEFRLLRGIKEALDPAGIFSPGRFAGGL